MSVNNDYQRIAKAIEYLQENIERQPQLDEVAAHIHLSAAHFQKLFSRWAGVSPKKYLQVLTVEKAKALLSNKHPVLDTAEQLGLSSSSRLYDHFVNIEALTPGEFKKCAAGLEFGYGTSLTPFGWVFIAQTNKGIHQLQFMESPEDDSHLEKLKQQWPQARFREDMRNQFPNKCVEATPKHSKRTAQHLLKTGPATRQTTGRSSRGQRRWRKPCRFCYSLSPSHSKKRPAWRLPLGLNPQTGNPYLGDCKVIRCGNKIQPMLTICN